MVWISELKNMVHIPVRFMSGETGYRRGKMNEDSEINRGEVLALTAEIVSAHLANNAVGHHDVPDLIQSVFGKLTELASGEEVANVELTPAVPIRKSVTDDHIICLEDGKKLKMLKRHLMTAYGMTPEEYRAKWSLKPDYPMVAPNYAAKRQELAKKIGLGRKPRN
jgi:predicted transcriptional regulator